MKTINHAIIVLLLLIFSCTPNTKKNEQFTDSAKNTSEVNSVKTITPKNSLLNSETLEKQFFKVNGKQLVKLTSKGGVKFTIPKNCFVDSNGDIIDGDIEIEFKEALNPTDIVLGNMTTTYDGKFLESGGMIYINASANGEQLSLANNKAIDFEVPAAKRKKGMMLFEGKEESGKINWVEPKKIDEPKKNEPQIIEVVPMGNLVPKPWWHNQNYFADLTAKDTFAFVYKVSDKRGKNVNIIIGKDANDALLKKLRNIIKKDNTINDSTVKIGDFSVRFKTNLSYLEILSNQQDFLLGDRSVFPQKKGTNTFAEDKITSYVFRVKKLGWANIDRLFNDPRTKDVKFITKIDDSEAFDKLYISILFPAKNMYLPGYQKKDGTFSFTHGDYEEPKFPVGETAIIVATGYKSGVPYMALKKLVIAKTQTILLLLKETTEDQLKADLKAKI
jgi:hypothetical protein